MRPPALLQGRPSTHCVQAVSELTFTSSRRDDRAVQAVQVAKGAREQTFTFCLQRIERGPYKACTCGCQPCRGRAQQSDSWCPAQACWLTVGLRVGNYAV